MAFTVTFSWKILIAQFSLTIVVKNILYFFTRRSSIAAASAQQILPLVDVDDNLDVLVGEYFMQQILDFVPHQSIKAASNLGHRNSRNTVRYLQIQTIRNQ